MADATKHTECRIKRNGQQRATAVSGGIYVWIELYAVSSQPKGTPRTGFTRVLVPPTTPLFYILLYDGYWCFV